MTMCVSRHQKGKPFWILMKQEIMGWHWHQLDHMQIICTSLQTDNHASTSSLGCPDALPVTQPTASKHWKHSNTAQLLFFVLLFCQWVMHIITHLMIFDEIFTSFQHRSYSSIITIFTESCSFTVNKQIQMPVYMPTVSITTVNVPQHSKCHQCHFNAMFAHLNRSNTKKYFWHYLNTCSPITT